MLKVYKGTGLSSPSWLVKKIGREELIACFSRLADKHKIGRLLDIGCGSGEKREVIPQYAEYVGVDYEGCPHGKSAVDVCCTAYDLPFLNGSFDTVFCNAVIEHLEEPAEALKEAFRVLRPGGYAVYSAPLFWHLHEEPRDFLRYTKHGLKHLFEEACFRVEEIKPLSGFWTTFGSEFNYYIRRFARGPARCVVNGITAVGNLACMTLDRKGLRDERFTWTYLVTAQKPEENRL